ncbi:MAG: type II toxin-antitoxin system RelB/DinJ family antitoxin [Coriobacteriia bacterium]|nr:type II toxin-antitoxin system RelB/DinJ family antitoxin [Coriobacteriia bacterium]
MKANANACATVTARVPAEIKAQVDRKLKDMGLSATMLVNAAYEFVLVEGRLPVPQGAQSPRANKPQTKALSEQDAKAFAAAWSQRAVLEAPAYDGSNFKELLGQAKGDYYARFA